MAKQRCRCILGTSKRLSPLHWSQWLSLALTALLILLVLMGRFLDRRAELAGERPAPVVVRLSGVAQPGVHLLEPPASVAGAVEAAGGCPDGSMADLTDKSAKKQVHTGECIEITCLDGRPDRARIGEMNGAARLTLGLKLNLNRAEESELLLIPGMREAFARAIAKGRGKKPWGSLDELQTISGVGPKTVEKWRKFLTVSKD